MKKTVFLVLLLVSVLVSLSFSEPQTVVLQQGLSNYTGCEDQEMRNPKANYGQGPVEELLVISEW